MIWWTLWALEKHTKHKEMERHRRKTGNMSVKCEPLLVLCWELLGGLMKVTLKLWIVYIMSHTVCYNLIYCVKSSRNEPQKWKRHPVLKCFLIVWVIRREWDTEPVVICVLYDQWSSSESSHTTGWDPGPRNISSSAGETRHGREERHATAGERKQTEKPPEKSSAGKGDTVSTDTDLQNA